ncbi:MAG: Bug family tripartite tricarboxylate transporter substrate binding protein [Burkholderiales bacterium]
MASIAAFTFSFAHVGEAAAQSYPVKPVRVIVPLAPGGGNDTLARFMAKPLTAALGQQMVVENRPGGGGLIGGEFVARAAPDGYTLVVAGSGLLVVTLTHRKLDLQKDLEPVAVIGEYASLLVVHPSLPVKSVRELIAFAKARPGALNYGTAGIGSAGHLVTEMFRARAGLDMVHVPYKGAGPALTELTGGQVTMLLSNPMGSKPLVEAGRLRPLAVSGPRRLAALPDVPTLAESGLPGFSSTFFLGLMGPAGLPRDIVARLNKETVSVLQRREIREWLETRGMEPVGGTPEDFAARIKNDIEAMSKVIRDTGLRLN